MQINNVHAIPILNSNDNIIGTLSAKDLRGLTLENIGNLIKPTKDFVKITKGVQSFDVVDQGKVRVEDACAFMLKERVHHVWLTRGKIISGCVTPTDILRLFVLDI
jgi:signal-transduction protein with cAMP-binding, CBS, and nucleotidyltransferase domain